MYGHMGMGFGLGFLNLLGTILFWVAVFWAVRFFIRGGFKGGFSRSRHLKWRGVRNYGAGRPWENRSDEAEKVMRERLAKGEISEDEYAKLKSHLGVSDGNGGGNGGHNTPQGGPPRPEGGPLGWLRGDGALELARLRFAKGEIGADEFEIIRRVLTS